MAEAKLNREYALRIMGVGAMMCGMCVWSLFDGMSAWPQKNRDLEQIRPVLLATNLTAEAWIGRGEEGVSPLAAAFQEKGLNVPAKLIKKLGELKLPASAENMAVLREGHAKRVRKLFEGPVYGAHDLSSQFVQAAVTFVLGALAFVAVGIKARRVYVADETGLHGSGFGGQRLAYEDLAKIDWSKWDEKGIVKLTLKSGRPLKLDGWHFAGITGIVDEIKRHRPDLAATASRSETGAQGA